MGATTMVNMKAIHLRLVAAVLMFIGFNVAAWFGGDLYVRMLLPLYHEAFATFTSHYQVQSLRIEQKNGERIVRIHVLTAGIRRLSGQWVKNDVPLSSSTLMGHAWQHVIVLFTALMLWPVGIWWERMVLMVLAIPALILVEMLDIPLVLAGALEDLMLFHLAPGRLSSSLLVQGMHFMNNGGRIAISLIGAGLVVLAWQWLRRSVKVFIYPS